MSVLVLRFCVLKLVHRRKYSERAIFTASCRNLPALETIQLGSRGYRPWSINTLGSRLPALETEPVTGSGRKPLAKDQ